MDIKASKDKKIKDYKYTMFLGKGVYGQVCLSECQGNRANKIFAEFFFDDENFDSKYCAIKRYKLINQINTGIAFSTLRQINFMLSLKHENIVTAHEIFSQNQIVNVVMDHCLELEELTHISSFFQDLNNKKIMCYHIAKGLAYLHRCHVMHRDLKPENIFVNKRGHMKIGDFGLSKEFGSPKLKLTPSVCTILYRAPQLFFGTNYYTQKTDIWSLGCILYYIFTGEHLFFCSNSSQVMVLKRIFSRVGVPNQNVWKHYRNFPITFEFKDFEPQRISSQKLLNKDIAPIIEQCLSLDPEKRPSASKILQHPFFADVKDQVLEIQQIYNRKLEKLVYSE